MKMAWASLNFNRQNTFFFCKKNCLPSDTYVIFVSDYGR